VPSLVVKVLPLRPELFCSWDMMFSLVLVVEEAAEEHFLLCLMVRVAADKNHYLIV